MTKVQLLPLKNQEAFNYVSQKAVKYSSRFFILLIANFQEFSSTLSDKNILSHKSPIYTGFKISKKYGKAVQRNLLRRRIKSIYHLFVQKNYHPLGLIFIPRPAIKELEYLQMKNEIEKGINWGVKKLGL